MSRMTPWAALAALVVASAGSARAQDDEASRADYYAMGERFARCSAHWAFAAEIAQTNDLQDAATAFKGMERGWSVAGQIFLTEGLHASRQSEVGALFQTLQQVKVESLRAEREIARSSGDTGFDARAGDRFQQECAQWTELQQAVIRELRSGPTE